MKPVALLVVAGVAWAGWAGCALTSRAPAREIRYFTPETAGAPAATRSQHAFPHAELRLGHVTASANLRYAIVHRDSPVEVEPYDTLRWTELPDAYVARALTKALFDQRGLTEAVAGDAPTLDVDVTEFEEVRGARPAGRVTLTYTLRDHDTVIQRGTIAIDRPASSTAIEPVVEAIRAAMTVATNQVADRVSLALAHVPTPTIATPRTDDRATSHARAAPPDRKSS